MPQKKLLNRIIELKCNIMTKKTFSEMLAATVQELRSNGQWGTAHIYKSAGNSFARFAGNETTFNDLTPELLKHYETYLRGQNRSWNTVSTYMKVIKAVYNKAVDAGEAQYIPRLFRHVHTSVRTERKKALGCADAHMLLGQGEHTPSAPLPRDLERAKATMRLMFLLRGIPFVDLAYMRKSDIQGDTLQYRRRKTGKHLNVTLQPEALRLIEMLSSPNDRSPYLFPFLQSPEGSEAAYHEYQCALRHFNRQLSTLSQQSGCSVTLSSYTARHTWATMAYYCEIHPGIISEAMGHSSIAVTETYLKPFRDEKIDHANRQVISYIKRYAAGH